MSDAISRFLRNRAAGRTIGERVAVLSRLRRRLAERVGASPMTHIPLHSAGWVSPTGEVYTCAPGERHADLAADIVTEQGGVATDGDAYDHLINCGWARYFFSPHYGVNGRAKATDVLTLQINPHCCNDHVLRRLVSRVPVSLVMVDIGSDLKAMSSDDFERHGWRYRANDFRESVINDDYMVLIRDARGKFNRATKKVKDTILDLRKYGVYPAMRERMIAATRRMTAAKASFDSDFFAANRLRAIDPRGNFVPDEKGSIEQAQTMHDEAAKHIRESFKRFRKTFSEWVNVVVEAEDTLKPVEDATEDLLKLRKAVEDVQHVIENFGALLEIAGYSASVGQGRAAVKNVERKKVKWKDGTRT